MLIKVSIENFKSFDKREELSMISSSKIQAKAEHKIKIKQTNLLKHALIYGANASGKSNFVTAIAAIKYILLEGLPVDSSKDFCRNCAVNENRESVFELQFTVGERFFAYGFSVIFSQRKITEEWLYQLLQDGTAKNIFLHEAGKKPVLDAGVLLTDVEKNRFSVYAEDFAEQDTRLFLAEMSKGKKYGENSHLNIFPLVFKWILNNIILITPNVGISSNESYNSEESLERISELLRSFDTGISSLRTKTIAVEEMKKSLPAEVTEKIFADIKKKFHSSNNLSNVHILWRTNEGFYNINVKENSEPEITTLVLEHGKSEFEFEFGEESDGTKRLIDLVDMLSTKRDDTVFIIDELERSLHPKLTERFLKLFVDAHINERMQLLFTTHEAAIMDQDLFRRDEIWFVERDASGASSIYSLDRFKERYDRKLSKAYLEGRYGAIPVFKHFSFEREE